MIIDFWWTSFGNESERIRKHSSAVCIEKYVFFLKHGRTRNQEIMEVLKSIVRNSLASQTVAPAIRLITGLYKLYYKIAFASWQGCQR